MALDSGSSNHQRFRTGCQAPILRYVVLEFVSLSVLAGSEVQTVSALLYVPYSMLHDPYLNCHANAAGNFLSK